MICQKTRAMPGLLSPAPKVPELKAGQTVLISAHGNSLRALVKHLSGISDDEITGLEIPTGQPIVYDMDDALNAAERYYLSET
jgi:2,3-bisphosphoglycerate-dependent phosphoglycerate mutase